MFFKHNIIALTQHRYVSIYIYVGVTVSYSFPQRRKKRKNSQEFMRIPLTLYILVVPNYLLDYKYTRSHLNAHNHTYTIWSQCISIDQCPQLIFSFCCSCCCVLYAFFFAIILTERVFMRSYNINNNMHLGAAFHSLSHTHIRSFFSFICLFRSLFFSF